MAYVKASDFSVILPNADLTLLEVAINAVTAMIDNACRRTFGATVATKTFTVDDPLLLIPDFLPNASAVTVTLDGVEISESVYSNGLPSDGYEWLPANGTPKTALKLHNVTGSHLAITGTWGFGSVPDDIKAAAIVLTRIAYNILRGRGKKNERTANYSVTYADVEAVFPAHDLIERLCGAYRRVEV